MPEKKPISASKEKAEFILLGILALVFLILGFSSIKHRLKAPFTLNQKTVAEGADQSLEALKAKDTDQDSLSDYDEQFLYNTSPYIADSDSDGLKDADEISSGADPNCPKGKVCSTSEFRAASSTPSAGPNYGEVDFSSVIANLGSGGGVTAIDLRRALIDAGIDKKILDSIDDQTLQSLYLETIKETQQ